MEQCDWLHNDKKIKVRGKEVVLQEIAAFGLVFNLKNASFIRFEPMLKCYLSE